MGTAAVVAGQTAAVEAERAAAVVAGRAAVVVAGRTAPAPAVRAGPDGCRQLTAAALAAAVEFHAAALFRGTD